MKSRRWLLAKVSSPVHILSVLIFKDQVYYYLRICCASVLRMTSFCDIFQEARHVNSLYFLPFHIPGQHQQLITHLLLEEA
jgi:hypothetical protein